MNIMSFPRKHTLSFPRKRESKSFPRIDSRFHGNDKKSALPLITNGRCPLFLLAFLILFLCTPGAARAGDSLAPIACTISPETSPESPTVHDLMLLKMTEPVPAAKYYRLERVSDLSGAEIVQAAGFPRHFDTTDFVFDLTRGVKGKTSIEEGPVYLRLSAWSDLEKYGGARISEYSNVIEVHYDHRFENLEFDIEVTYLEAGDFILKPVPKMQGLSNQIKSYTWVYYKPELDSDSNPVLDADGYPVYDSAGHDVTTKPEIKISFSEPGIKYIGLKQAWNGLRADSAPPANFIGLKSRSAPLVDGRYIPVALIVKPENEAAEPPVVVSGFTGMKYIHPEKIPGDVKFALLKEKITLFSGGSVSTPLDRPDTDAKFAEVEVPAGIEIADYKSDFNNAYGYTVVDISGEAANGSLANGYKRYKLIKRFGNVPWSDGNRILPLFIKFTSDSIIGKNDLLMRLRIYKNESDEERTDNWQTLGISCEKIPDVVLPKRIKTGLTWACFDLFINSDTDPELNFLSIYKKLGFNMVPSAQLSFHNPEKRPEKYPAPDERGGPEWEGLFYAPEHSTFHNGYYGKGLSSLLKEDVGYVDTFDFSEFDLTPDEIEKEKTKWRNSLEYYALPETRGIDIAYEGIFLTRDLGILSKAIQLSKPDYIFIDSEVFPHRHRWIQHISKSKNAEARRLPGETDEALADRIADEFLTALARAVYDVSPETKIAFYDATPSYNYGYRCFSWELFEKHGIIAQPSVYTRGRVLGHYGELLRLNRQALPKGYELMPWITTGAYGEMDTKYVFDMVAHTLLNGSTGFSVYSAYLISDSDIDDMGDILNMARAIGCVSPYEDIVMDGDVAFDDIENVENAVVSAMKLNGEYLLAVSPKDPDNPVSFSLNTGSSDKHVLYDIRHDTKTTFDSGDISYNDTPGESTVFHLTTDIDKYTDTIEGDVNEDGRVDILDLVAVAAAFGSETGNARWNADADVNEDGTVDIRDLVAVAREFGRQT